MIKINLLPTKKRPPKKVIDLQQQLLLGFLILVLVLMAMAFFWTRQKDQRTALQNEKVSTEARIRSQDDILRDVKDVEEGRRQIAEKIEVIEKLKKNQAEPVRLLDEVSKALPVGVNLTSLIEINDNINIEGEAFTNDNVVKFVDNLKSSPYLSSVMLLETSRIKLETFDIYKYKLQFVYKGL